MSTVDDELRHIARAATADALTDEEVAAGLAAVRRAIADGDLPTTPVRVEAASRLRRWPLTASIAAAVALAAAGATVLVRDDRGGSIHSPGSVEPTSDPATTSSLTTTPATTLPSTRQLGTTPPTSETLPPTTMEAIRTIAVDAADPPPLIQPVPIVRIPLTPNDSGSSIQVAIGDGQIAVRQPTDDGITLVDTRPPAGTEPALRFVATTEQLWTMVLGPGDVIYGMGEARLQPTGVPEAFRYVAIALAGERTGEVVAEADLSFVAYTELPDGAFGHGATGVVDRVRDVGQTVLGYVDTAGVPLRTTVDAPQVTSTDDTVSDGTTTWRLDVTTAPGHVVPFNGGLPPSPTTSGRVVVALEIGPALQPGSDYGHSEMPVVAILEPDGSGRWVRLPEGWSVAASDVWGTVLLRVADGNVDVALLDDALAAAPSPPLTRPLVDLDGCTVTGAFEQRTVSDDALFARRSTEPVAIQAYGDPSNPYESPFVLVQRYSTGQTTEEPGPPGVTSANPTSGRRSATWRLADGSEAYVNARDLTDAELVDFVTSLRARPADAPVPGFDAPGSATLQLLDETASGFETEWSSGSACRFDDGTEASVRILAGRPLGRFAALLDHPAPLPVASRLPDGRTLIASTVGTHDPRAVLAAVRQATDEEWAQLPPA